MLDVRFGVVPRYPELERLICAAVSNKQFADQLISAPDLALEQSGHGTNLSAAERALVLSIKNADDIYDFAAKLHAQAQSLARAT